MEYKGYIIEGNYFTKSENVNFDYTNLGRGMLVEKDKEFNRKTITLEYYDGNGKITDAIDLLISLKDKELPKETASVLLDHWFNDLGKDAIEYRKTFDPKFDHQLNNRYYDVSRLKEVLMDYSENSIDMKSFLTDDKITEIFTNQNIRLKIQYAKNGNLNRITM